ncbi:hypothetical protein TgHK011_008919 [Trichoderma gracile]|nr:hypothetical protein TgHK011_008919 [Trichoderma gracile]
MLKAPSSRGSKIKSERLGPSTTAMNHPGHKAGEPRQVPCATCVRRLTSDSTRQDEPCYSHIGRKAVKCFQCSSKKKLCPELPATAVAFGQEFQKATIRRYQGQEADDWEFLGEETMKAINKANEERKKRARRGLAGIFPIAATAVSVEDDTSECGQSQVDPEEYQPTIEEQLQQPQAPQAPCQEEPVQSNGKFQPPSQDMASRQDLQDLRAQILHDVRQVLGESRQPQGRGESREKGFAASTVSAAESPTEQSSLNETVREIIDSAQRSREGVATIVIHFH